MEALDEKKIIAELAREGFSDIRVVPLPPHEDLPAHRHDLHTVHVILEGGLIVTDGKAMWIFHPGERVEFSAGTVHKARGMTEAGRMVVGIRK